MSQFLVDNIEQLDVALDQLKVNDRNFDRFAFMLIDNVIELTLHNYAVEKSIENHIEAYKTILLESWEEFPNYFITSSSNYAGKEALLNYIDAINSDLDEHAANQLPFQ